jgi:hypothetical protein
MARKKNEQSDVPKKPGRFAQVKQVFTAARKVDPLIPWWMLLAFVAVLVVAVGIGFLVGHPWYAGFVGLPLALLAATLVLSRRAERAAYTALEGQAGASGAALGSLRRGWYFTQEPVAADATRPTDVANAAMVFRAVGRPGVVLIAEGPQARAGRLVEGERKKLARIAPGVPVSVLHAGDAEEQVRLDQLELHQGRLAVDLDEVDSRVGQLARREPQRGLRRGVLGRGGDVRLLLTAEVRVDAVVPRRRHLLHRM